MHGRISIVGAGLVGAMLLFGTPALGQQASQSQTLEDLFKVTRGELKARRDSALRTLVQLQGGELQKFTPIVQAYDAELAKIGDARLALMTEFGKVSDKLTPDQARQFASSFFKLEDDRSALRRKYYDRVAQEISPVVAVQFTQLERQFETMGDLKLATVAPLALR